MSSYLTFSPLPDEAGGYSLLRYSTLTDSFSLRSMVLYVARTFLSPLTKRRATDPPAMLMFVNKSLRSSVIALLRLDKLYSSGIAPEDATLRFAHEIENHVALLASGNFALYHTNGFGDCVAAVVEYAVYFLDEFDSF